MIFLRILSDNMYEDLFFMINYEEFYKDIDSNFCVQNKLFSLDLLSIFSYDNDLLVGFREYDKDLEPDKEEMSEYCLHSYHKGLYGDKNHGLNTVVKDTLFNHYFKDNNIEPLGDLNIVKNDLLQNFMKNSLSSIDEKLYKDLKYGLYNKNYICELNDYSIDIQNFVNERLALTSNNFYYPNNDRFNYLENPSYVRDLWIKLKGKKEILKYLDSINPHVTCVFTKDNSINNYRYYLCHHYEHIKSGSEEIIINILEKNKGDFIKFILPRLKDRFGEHISPSDSSLFI